MSDYKNLGNLSAVDPWATIHLQCDKCMVEWLGCMDAAECPKCGNTDDWTKQMEQRGYYEKPKPVFSNCNVCGRGLVREDELACGMCAVCANEEITEP